MSAASLSPFVRLDIDFAATRRHIRPAFGVSGFFRLRRRFD
jgi:hypothetical protein